MKSFNHFQNGLGARPAQGQTADSEAILIGFGANLPSRFGTPVQTLQAAQERLQSLGVRIVRRSRFWRSAPVPVSDQPWYVNAVASVETDLGAEELLALLHRVEDEFGRVRTIVNAPRLLDLDLLAYGRQVKAEGPLILPHPRLGQRAFVLLPLSEIAPMWLHPINQLDVTRMKTQLSPDQIAEPIQEEG
jgi:2-amino-4-hydroxy-6-hydroxymethyldihydropteridine diphosphokinase